MSATPKLELRLEQQPPPEHYYFHLLPVGAEILSCEDCGEGRQIAEFKVSMAPPFRHRAPLCAKHTEMAKAEWMLNL